MRSFENINVRPVYVISIDGTTELIHSTDAVFGNVIMISIPVAFHSMMFMNHGHFWYSLQATKKISDIPKLLKHTVLILAFLPPLSFPRPKM